MPTVFSAARRTQQPSAAAGAFKRSGDNNAPRSAANVFVACLPRWMDNCQLLQLFASFNPASGAVMMDAHNGRSKGFGFVTFHCAADGERAIASLNGKTVTFEDATFSLYLSPSKYDGAAACPESTRIYLRHIPIELNDNDLIAYYSRFGKVKQIELRKDVNGSEWLGTLEFATIPEAKSAINHSHGKLLFPELSCTPVMAKFADVVDKNNNRRRKKADANPPVVSRVLDAEPQPSALKMPLRVSPDESPLSVYKMLGAPTTPALTSSSICGCSTPSSARSTSPRSGPDMDAVSQPRAYRHEPYAHAAFTYYY